MLRRADAGDDILALRIDEVFAVELLHAGRRVAGEGDAGGAILATIAEHHRLDADRRAPARRDVVQLPEGDRPGIHPPAAHRHPHTPPRLLRVLRYPAP